MVSLAARSSLGRPPLMTATSTTLANRMDHQRVAVLNTLSLWQVGQLRVLGRYIGQLPLARVAVLHLRHRRLCRGDVAVWDLVVLGTVRPSPAVSAHCSVLILVAC